jgi:hypothetical protein
VSRSHRQGAEPTSAPSPTPASPCSSAPGPPRKRACAPAELVGLWQERPRHPRHRGLLGGEAVAPVTLGHSSALKAAAYPAAPPPN